MPLQLILRIPLSLYLHSAPCWQRFLYFHKHRQKILDCLALNRLGLLCYPHPSGHRSSYQHFAESVHPFHFHQFLLQTGFQLYAKTLLIRKLPPCWELQRKFLASNGFDIKISRECHILLINILVNIAIEIL